MSSIGPQLPPQAPKRKRTPEDDNEDAPASPPTKNARTSDRPPVNEDELDIEDSDSDADDYGPKAPAPIAGPSLPPSNNDEITLDDGSDSDDDIGPARPPSKPTTAGPSLPTASTSTSITAGPAQPPPADPGSSSDEDDDDYGPSLPTAATRPQIGPAMPPAPEDAPQRDSWMLAPPTSSGYTERDPTRIKARKFASKSSATPAGTQASSIWTETPEEKLQRLQDSVMGRTAPGAAAQDGQSEARSKEEEERNRRIAASVEAKRGKSLYDEHGEKRKQKGQDKEEEDDPSKRAFDREKDMALGGKIGTAQRRELLNKAANFGGRFQKGSFL